MLLPLLSEILLNSYPPNSIDAITCYGSLS